MAEGMMGRFSDYTRSPEGIYDPWAVGINAAMGGYQYGRDRAAQEQERLFSEQQRGRTRKDWATMDKAQQIAKQLEEKYQLPDEEKYFPEDQGPGFPGVSIEPAGTIQSPQLGAVMAPGVSIAPAGTIGAPQLQSAGAAPIAPPQVAVQRRERPFDMYSPRARRLEADKFRALATEYQKLDPRLLRDDIADAMSRGQEAYGKYVDAAVVGITDALNRGDPTAFEKWKADHPDLARADFGGTPLADIQIAGPKRDIANPDPNAPGGFSVAAVYPVRYPDGRVHDLTSSEMYQLAATVKRDPSFFLQAGEYGEARDNNKFNRAAKAEELRQGAERNQISRAELQRQATYQANSLALEQKRLGFDMDAKSVEHLTNRIMDLETKGASAIEAALVGGYRVAENGALVSGGENLGVTVPEAGKTPINLAYVTGAEKVSRNDIVGLSKSIIQSTMTPDGQFGMSYEDAAKHALIAGELMTRMRSGPANAPQTVPATFTDASGNVYAVGKDPVSGTATLEVRRYIIDPQTRQPALPKQPTRIYALDAYAARAARVRETQRGMATK